LPGVLVGLNLKKGDRKVALLGVVFNVFR